jgi:putative membrane protein
MGTALIVNQPEWLQHGFMHIKLTLVFFLYMYHFSLHRIFQLLRRDIVRYTSQQLRIWNEVATLFLIGIVFIIVLKNAFSMIWGIAGLLVVTLLIMTGIKLYKKLRKND